MTTLYNNDQNTLRFCFLGKLGLSLFKPRWDYQILNMKGKTKTILVVLVKWRHSANGLFSHSFHLESSSVSFLIEISRARNSTLRFWLFKAILIKEALELVCGVPIADGSQSVFEQKETKLRIRGISYCEISLGGFALLTTGNSANISLSFLICPASVCWLMRDIRNRKVPSNSLNLLSDITSIHSYSTRSSSIKYLLY